MIEKLGDVPDGVIGVRASGTLTAQDYASVVDPLVDELTREGRRGRFLVEVAPDFRGLTPAALVQDVRDGVRAIRSFDGCAVVTDVAWIRRATAAAAAVLPYPLRTFRGHQRAAAQAWLVALPAGGNVTARLVPDSGVVVVEAAGALRVEDVQALAAVVDPWLDEHPDLPGLVVRAPHFPGWATLGALLRHLGFVGTHHRRVGRLAVVVGGRLAPQAAGLAGRIVHPQVRWFDPDDLDAAVAWAGSAATDDPATPRSG
ncbi:STAS/SEC14 domain-containing protein [Pseudonocardia sp.]|uniref:STAS/SEC14 domain-containing protein n=1 Tax=Pseudonocardia sp. TaxID=60912 RepID=UPI003D10ADC5